MGEFGSKIIDFITALVVAIATFLVGEYDMPLICAITLMVIDYISGNVKAWINGEVSSSKGMKGIIKKSSYFLVIIVANILDALTGVYIARLVVCYMIIGTEAWSILENAGAMGAPIHPILYEKLEQIKSYKPNSGGE